MLSLNVFGRFLISDPSGKDRSPKSAKARGILALLAMSQGFSRNRGWLQDKLWSDRDTKRGADSLRQTLVEIRRAFGPYKVILKADREKVVLDPSRFSTIYNRPSLTHDWNDELNAFSDLDVPDPEFEDWIRDLRTALPDKVIDSRTSECQARAPAKPAIFLTTLADRNPASDALGRRFITLITAALLDLDDFQIFPHRKNGEPVPSAGLWISVHVATQRRQSQITLTIEHPQTKQLYWSRLFSIPRRAVEIADIHQECGTMVQAIVSTLRERKNELGISDTVALLAAQARSQIFRFDRQSLKDADNHLQYAYNRQPRPQYLAWRAFLRNMAQFQHRSSTFLDDPITATELAKEAMREASGSASVLGISAHLEYLGGGSSRGSLSLAERAVSLDPLNAVNLAVLSNSELALDKLIESRSSALTALALSDCGEHRAFIEFFCCMSAAALTDYTAAIRHAEAAVILRPSFLAPLRYLVALYKQMGMAAELEKAIIRLRILEPDFHQGRFLESDYPVTTMRRIRLIEAVGG